MGFSVFLKVKKMNFLALLLSFIVIAL